MIPLSSVNKDLLNGPCIMEILKMYSLETFSSGLHLTIQEIKTMNVLQFVCLRLLFIMCIFCVYYTVINI